MSKVKQLKFQDKLKRYLASLSSRKVKYLYINLIENRFILTNADSELLAPQYPHSFFIHLVEFKDDFYNEFMNFLELETKQWYCIKVPLLLKVLKTLDNGENIVKPIYDENDYLRFMSNNIYIEADEEAKEDEDDLIEEESEELTELFDAPEEIMVIDTTICGQVVDTDITSMIIYDEALSLFKFNENDTNYHKFNFKDLNVEQPYFSDIYKLSRIDLNALNLRVKYLFNTLILSGIDTPDVKQFINKSQEYECFIYTILQNKVIRCITIFNDQYCHIKTTRPYWYYNPLLQ